MNRYYLMMVLLWFSVLLCSASAVETCEDCHRQETPGAFAVWQESAHAAGEIGCADCHGDDHEAILAGLSPVDAKVCGACHKEAFAEHSKSKHGLGLHVGWGCTRNQQNRNQDECNFCHRDDTTIPFSEIQCARFLKQSSSMGELGCNRCHMVETSCGSCHSNHATDLALVRNPNVCAKCHMGPDHPQWEIWQTSQHGTLNLAGATKMAPDCQRCHMPAGTHNVSFGITKTPGGAAISEDIAHQRRAEMLELCAECHAKSFVDKELKKADLIWSEQKALIDEARKIIEDVYDHGALDPMPADRPLHPLRGKSLVLDGQMLYEDISHIERLFFKMKKYDFSKAFKGAYHQNPAYTHWYGNAEVKMTLEDIKAEASRLLKQQRRPEYRESPAIDAEEMERELLYLKKRNSRGELTVDEYNKRRTEILEQLISEDLN